MQTQANPIRQAQSNVLPLPAAMMYICEAALASDAAAKFDSSVQSFADQAEPAMKKITEEQIRPIAKDIAENAEPQAKVFTEKVSEAFRHYINHAPLSISVCEDQERRQCRSLPV